MRTIHFIAVLVSFLPGVSVAEDSQLAGDQFLDQVWPLFQSKCITCHGDEKQEGGLRLDSREAVLKGGDTGAAMLAGKPDESLLMAAVRHRNDDLQMPPKEKLSEEQIGYLASWIKNGAPWPRPVAVLFEDEAEIVPALTEGGGEVRLADDRFAGTVALAVKPQRFAARISGWNFPIAENPGPGEFRFLRFAWKKTGGGAIMFEIANAGKWREQQHADGAWVAGKNSTGWNAFSAADNPPEEWTVVTRDLWEDRGSWDALLLTGMTLTAIDGGEALLDSVILGPDVASLARYQADVANRGLIALKPKSVEQIGDAFSDAQNPIVKLFKGERLDLWSLRPSQKVEPPQVSNESWPRTPIDRFILAKLEKNQLAPSPTEDRSRLLRRVYFDLLGLPPTPEEVNRFVNDKAADAYEQLVDRLLKDKRYGQHLARMWLDVVRYADTNGYERDEFRPLVYRYRDYVIESFNADKPYDVFLREQLAGDEMLSGAPQSLEDVQRLIATGFMRLGPYDSTASIFQEDEKARNELMADLVNTTGSAMLGLTMSCCNCHDHKYDPLSQADHFRLRAFFAGVEARDDTPLDLPAERAEIAAHNNRLDEQLGPLEKQLEQTPEDKTADREKLSKQIEDLKSQKRQPRRAITMADKGPDPPATFVFYQGDHTEPRDEVPAGFLSCLDPNPATIVRPIATNSSGRRSTLADWIVSADNPFTARVMANRIWQQLFGRGLVETPNDFGYSGARPTQAELLDWLALEFQRQGWSIKQLHRLIMMSAVYRQASLDNASKSKADPDNHLLWRQNPRRLTAEMTRDAILAVSGQLLPYNAGPPRWPPVAEEILYAQPAILETKSDQGARDRLQGWYADPLEETYVRSIFLVQKRAVPLPLLQPFDLPDNNVSCGRRDTTTVSPQALNLLNSEFTARMAAAFAARVERESESALPERVSRAVWLALSRPPREEEIAVGVELLRRHAELHQDAGNAEPRQRALIDLCRALLNVNEFVYFD